MRFIGIFILLGLLLPHQLFALPEVKPTFPRLANYFLHWTISEAEARELAKFDLVILDAEAQERSRAELKLLRHLNPRAILLAYVPAAEIRRDVASLREIAPLRYKLGAGVPEQWYVHDAAGARRSFWPGTWIVNVTNFATRTELSSVGTELSSGGPMRWNEYLPQFVAREILANDIWDGVFYDNAWDEIVHFARGAPDLDGDGAPDEAVQANRAWQQGLRALYAHTRALAPNKLIVQNDGVIYAPEVHGVLLENFPRKGFARYLKDLRVIREQARDPAIPILNATTFNTGAREDWRAIRFGLGAALFTDSF